MQPGIRQDETVAWDFDGDGVVDDTAHSPYASHVFSTSGVFTVTLTLTNPAGVSDSVYRTVFVEDAVPVASFTPSSFIGRAPYTINFTNQTTGHVVAWAWDFDGDGVTDSQAESPSFTYTVDGTFNATLIASNDTGDSTFSVVITILPELQLQ